MSTVLTIRDDLAGNLATALGDAVNVYPHPVEQVALPAAVIVPADPYWAPSRFGQVVDALVRVRLDVHIIVPRGELSSAFESLETYAVAVGVATLATPPCRWLDLSSSEAIEVGDVPALFARVTVEAQL